MPELTGGQPEPQPWAREFVCNGMCLQARPSIHEIAERRITLAGLYEQAYFGVYATPAQAAAINNTLDGAHDAAHILAERIMWKGW